MTQSSLTLSVLATKGWKSSMMTNPCGGKKKKKSLEPVRHYELGVGLAQEVPKSLCVGRQGRWERSNLVLNLFFRLFP